LRETARRLVGPYNPDVDYRALRESYNSSSNNSGWQSTSHGSEPASSQDDFDNIENNNSQKIEEN